MTGAGIFIRDEESEFVLGKTLTRRGILTVDEGEAWDLLQTLTWLSDLGMNKVDIEVDSMNLRNALQNVNVDLSVFGDYVSECKVLLSQNCLFQLGGLIEMPINWHIV
ncbi:hypothetical protein ACS0TY_014324 [Phlomoides rotata]